MVIKYVFYLHRNQMAEEIGFGCFIILRNNWNQLASCKGKQCIIIFRISYHAL